MPPWLPRVLTRIRTLAAEGRMVFTEKAIAELADLRFEREDVVEILRGVGPGDDPTRLRSGSVDTWLYVFRPVAPGLLLYLKVALRQECVVISCHEDQAQAREEPAREQ